ncbi:MAG: transposase [Gemmataceae bacterium]|nr:transposase [Gemmataceae bacterium]
MPFSHLPAALSPWLTHISGALDRRSAPRLLLLLLGALFAEGRRTVTSWLRAAGITATFRRAYSALWAAGRRAEALAARLLGGALGPLMRRAPGDHLVFALDDTPTARYGPHVQGAGVHHNPSPGPAGEKFGYGHVWVTLAWVVRHPLWHTLSLPLHALLYVRAKDVPRLAQAYPWDFHTKLELAADLVRWLLLWLGHTGKALWLAVDGAYAKRPFLKPALALGLGVFSRLRRDARLGSLPMTRRRPGRRRPLPTYGKDKIDLAKRAGQKRGWHEVECVQYGQRVTKTIKTFAAVGERAESEGFHDLATGALVAPHLAAVGRVRHGQADHQGGLAPGTIHQLQLGVAGDVAEHGPIFREPVDRAFGIARAVQLLPGNLIAPQLASAVGVEPAHEDRVLVLDGNEHALAVPADPGTYLRVRRAHPVERASGPVGHEVVHHNALLLDRRHGLAPGIRVPTFVEDQGVMHAKALQGGRPARIPDLEAAEVFDHQPASAQEAKVGRTPAVGVVAQRAEVAVAYLHTLVFPDGNAPAVGRHGKVTEGFVVLLQLLAGFPVPADDADLVEGQQRIAKPDRGLVDPSGGTAALRRHPIAVFAHVSGRPEAVRAVKPPPAVGDADDGGLGSEGLLHLGRPDWMEHQGLPLIGQIGAVGPWQILDRVQQLARRGVVHKNRALARPGVGPGRCQPRHEPAGRGQRDMADVVALAQGV